MTGLPAGFGVGLGAGLGAGLVTGLLTGATYRRTDGAAVGHVGHGGAASMSHDNIIICMGTLHRSSYEDMRTD